MGTIPTITSLSQLLKNIHTGPGYDSYSTLFEQIAFDASEVASFCKWSSDEYQKIVLDKADCYELILMCWEAGQESKIHNHSGAQSWITILEGELEEFIYQYNKQTESVQLLDRIIIAKGKPAYFNDDIGIHKIKNSYAGRTISLHYYANPANKVHLFDESTGVITKSNIHKK